MLGQSTIYVSEISASESTAWMQGVDVHLFKRSMQKNHSEIDHIIIKDNNKLQQFFENWLPATLKN